MKTLVHLPTQDAWDRYMEWSDKKGWRFNGGSRPTVHKPLYRCFPGVFAEYNDGFTRDNGTDCWDGENNVISLEEAIGEQFVEGEVVLASDDGDYWSEKIYLCTLPEGRPNKYITVSAGSEGKYNNKSDYLISYWYYIKKKPTVVEMTVEQISEKLGYEVKIVK